jgi:lipopolysaccharide export system permease protein
MFGRRATRTYRVISLYIAKEYLFSFFVAFLFFFTVFFVNQLLLLAEEILSKHVAPGDVALLIFYSLPAIIMFTFPFSSLVGGLMAMGRLSSDNELMAMRASGIPYRRLFLPLLIAGMFLTLTAFTMGDYFLPRGTVRFGNLYREILYTNPAVELEPNSVNRYRDTVIVTGDTEAGTIEDLVIFDRSDKGGSRVILSSTARLRQNAATGGVITLGLSDVFGHTVSSKQRGSYDYFSSESMEYNILLRDISFSVDNLSPREMSSADVYSGIVERRRELQQKRGENRRETYRHLGELRALYYGAAFPGSAPDRPAGSGFPSAASENGRERDGLPEEFSARAESLLSQVHNLERRSFSSSTLQVYRLEFHKKIAIPFGCIAFIVFAFPFGSFTGRGGRSVGFGIGLLLSVFYWAMLFAGQTLGLRFDVSPLLAMWAPNIILISIGAVLYRVRFRV